ncbi:hypothetical protein PIB30_076184 [Stylosanthes scabra]|uniref:Uncharacterized protein n=1 Tax=Stylosanthes scabra TaxID=79078 RepID=A0ABU6WNG0_9FABA|nr:hypothetical protein [Stylosanthes scabra]
MKQQYQISCHRNPTKPITDFCPSCLRDRLVFINPPPMIHPPLLKDIASPDRWSSIAPNYAPKVVLYILHPPQRRSTSSPAFQLPGSDLFVIGDGDDKKRPNLNLDAHLQFKVTVEESENGGNEVVRVCDDDFVSDENEEERKMMKEFIDLELGKRKSKENTATVTDNDGEGCGGGNEPYRFGGSDVMRDYKETKSEVGE